MEKFLALNIENWLDGSGLLDSAAKFSESISGKIGRMLIPACIAAVSATTIDLHKTVATDVASSAHATAKGESITPMSPLEHGRALSARIDHMLATYQEDTEIFSPELVALAIKAVSGANSSIVGAA